MLTLGLQGNNCIAIDLEVLVVELKVTLDACALLNLFGQIFRDGVIVQVVILFAINQILLPRQATIIKPSEQIREITVSADVDSIYFCDIGRTGERLNLCSGAVVTSSGQRIDNDFIVFFELDFRTHVQVGCDRQPQRSKRAVGIQISIGIDRELFGLFVEAVLDMDLFGWRLEGSRFAVTTVNLALDPFFNLAQ